MHHMKEAREALAAALGGRTSRQVGALKRQAACLWVYRWGYSAAGLIDAVAQRGKRGLAARMVRQGLLQPWPCPGAGGVKGVPLAVLTLTPAGVLEAELAASDAGIDAAGYQGEGTRYILWRQLRHDLLVQRFTAQRLAAGRIEEYRTPREIAAQSAAHVKQPDAVWLSGGQKLAVELELSVKKGRELDLTLDALLRAMEPGSGPFDAVVVISHSRSIRERYRSLLKPGARIQRWKRTPGNRWAADGFLTVPGWAAGRVATVEVSL